MENSNKIVPPHLNAEIYRNDTTGTSTQAYLDYIRLFTDGSVLIGSSELTGRYWNGGSSVFKNIIEAQKINNQENRSIPLTSGTADGCFIGSSNKVFLCEDSGAVSVWARNTEQNAWSQWSESLSAAEHDAAALTVDCLEPNRLYVTGGADGNIKVWDVNDLICVRNYISAHSMMINSVAGRPKSTTEFVTGSVDNFVTLWDDNVDKPVLDLMENETGIRSVAWIDDNRLISGDEEGLLFLIDLRKPDDYVKISDFPAAIHKVAVHPGGDKVAVCCDNKIVSVCDISEEANFKVIYHDRHMHTNFVRGLAWDVNDSKTLHTVGWNGELKTHNVLWD